ncbi:MAG: hypothetical protein FWE80_00620 [Oscillospiraceae bacterium]|nr:hypothetical protein [Oscillospiraceae bacterium]
MSEKDYAMKDATQIPQHEIDALARLFLPKIVAYYETEEGQRSFEEWKRQRDTTNKVGDTVEP